MAGSGTAKTSKKNLEAQQRKEKIIQARLIGMKLEDIGRQVGCTAAYAHKVIKKDLEEAKKRRMDGADQLLQLAFNRLERLLQTVMPRAIGGHLPSVDKSMRLVKQECELLGLEAPKKVAQTNIEGTETAYDQMSDEELAARLKELEEKT